MLNRCIFFSFSFHESFHSLCMFCNNETNDRRQRRRMLKIRKNINIMNLKIYPYIYCTLDKFFWIHTPKVTSWKKENNGVRKILRACLFRGVFFFLLCVGFLQVFAIIDHSNILQFVILMKVSLSDIDHYHSFIRALYIGYSLLSSYIQSFLYVSNFPNTFLHCV